MKFDRQPQSKFIPFGEIADKKVGITINTQVGKNPVINLVEQHNPITRHNSFKDVENSTLSRLYEVNFNSVEEAEEFLMNKGSSLV